MVKSIKFNESLFFHIGQTTYFFFYTQVEESNDSPFLTKLGLEHVFNKPDRLAKELLPPVPYDLTDNVGFSVTETIDKLFKDSESNPLGMVVCRAQSSDLGKLNV